MCVYICVRVRVCFFKAVRAGLEFLMEGKWMDGCGYIAMEDVDERIYIYIYMPFEVYDCGFNKRSRLGLFGLQVPEEE